MFSRPGSSVTYNYHSYITDNTTLHNIGLASYTRNTLDKFGMEQRNGQTQPSLNKDIAEYFGGENAFKNVKRGLLGDLATLSIMKFDKENRNYFLATNNGQSDASNIFWSPSGDGAIVAISLKDFQEKFDSYQKGFISDPIQKERLKEVWTNIQTSLSGCITFNMSYNTLACPQTSNVRLYFQSAGKSKNDRGIAYNGPPVIAAVPSSATGRQYSNNGQQSTPPGVYPAPFEGGANNPLNAVAGPLRVNYDPSTGKFESGTMQTLVRVLTDIDGVPLKDNPPDVDAVDISQYYEGEFSSEFKVGYGMVVSVENGNPHLFGPNTASACGPSKKEKILLVNRTPRSYAKGEIVLASLINGEWIPMGFGLPKTVSKKFDTKWSQIQKYIVDAKSFFRDQSDTKDILPAEYENIVRFQFYSSLATSTIMQSQGQHNNLDRLAVLNLLQPSEGDYSISGGAIVVNVTNLESIPNYAFNMNTVPSTGYLPIFDADVIKYTLGGNNIMNQLTYTNISHTDPDVDNEIWAGKVKSSWGMYFPDGYASSTVNRVKTNKGINSKFQTISNGTTIPIYNGGTLDFSASANDQFSILDSQLYHLPAQFALNASGNQSLYLPLLWGWQSKDGSYCNNLLSYMNDPIKGDYLSTTIGQDAYALAPLNATSVQFTPLSIGLALCSTQVVGSKYNRLAMHLAFDNRNASNLGKAWIRLKSPGLGFLIGTDDATRGNIGFSDRLLKINPNGLVTIDAPDRGGATKPDGDPEILPKLSTGVGHSNVVGVIGSMATINLPAGGQLSLKTNNNFGLTAWSMITQANGGTSWVFTGTQLFGTDNGGQNRKYDNVSWGASDEKINAFGTTSLRCKIYDHCPNTIYDARYFCPLQFNGKETSLEFDIPGTNSTTPLPVNTVVNSSIPNIVTVKNSIRKNMLLTGGGFYYIRNVIGANEIEIVNGGEGFSVNDTFQFPGLESAYFIVTEVGENGKIASASVNTNKTIDNQILGIKAYGRFGWSTGNPFRNRIAATNFTRSNTSAPYEQPEIYLKSGRVIERVEVDRINQHGTEIILTPPDNNGNGDTVGHVLASKTSNFNLGTNSTGKYDIFFFFVNDIQNYPENSMGVSAAIGDVFAQYVKLEMSAT